MNNNLDSIHVMPGLFCNYTCSHCVNDSGPKMSKKVSGLELDRIKNDVIKYTPKFLQFSGGESTFYANEINQIVAAHPDLENCEVVLTSNGWYGKSFELTRKTLDQFDYISKITLSFDVFHGNQTNINGLRNIKKYADENNIKLTISFCISSPVDLIKAKLVLEDIAIPVIYQRVDAVGRAKTNNLGYQFPTFEEEVLSQTCPNLKCVSFVPEKGFSICCGNLIFNGDNKEIYHNSISEHFKSPFYQRLNDKNFGEILKDSGYSLEILKANLSSACSICEYIHTKESL